jgi:hypothetical protein
MSTARARTMAYAAEVQKRNKRPDSNNFVKPGNPTTPAYQTVSRTNIDDTADETKAIRTEEKKLEDDKDRATTDKNDFAPGNPNGKAIIPDATTTREKAAAPELKEVYSKVWTTVDAINITKVFHDEKSMYIPNFISMMEVLSKVESTLDSNEELRWRAPRYFSLPARVYYAVIFYVQIYRAKHQAGTLTKSESSWLRAFDRRFRDVSCPIVGPLVPILSNITSVLPDDDSFDFVYPSAKQGGTYSIEQDSTTKKYSVKVDPAHFINPSVLMVADMLKQFCHLQTIGHDQFDDNGCYVPFRLENGGTLGGVTFPPQTADRPLEHTLAQLLFNPALMHPLPEDKTRLREIHSHFRKSRAKHIPVPATGHTHSSYGPADFTLLGEDKDWFQVCIEAAEAQTIFFSDSTNLSAIHTLGGHSSTLEAELFFTKATSTPTEIAEWFPDIYRQTKAKFRSTAADLPIDHMYNGVFALTNAKIQWTTHEGHKIGSRSSMMRSGPFWDNRKFNFTLEYETEVLNGISTMVQTHFYEARGKA